MKAGADTVSSISMMTEEELEVIGVKPLHAKIILKKALEAVHPVTHTATGDAKKH